MDYMHVSCFGPHQWSFSKEYIVEAWNIMPQKWQTKRNREENLQNYNFNQVWPRKMFMLSKCNESTEVDVIIDSICPHP